MGKSKVWIFFILVFVLIISIVLVNSDNKKPNDDVTLKIGNYTVNEVSEDEAGVPNSECGVEIKANNEFEIYMGWGAWNSGKYEIKDNKLICKSTLFKWESGSIGSRATDVIFMFDIIEINKLQLTNIEINDVNSEKLIYDEGLTIGMTYSVK